MSQPTSSTDTGADIEDRPNYLLHVGLFLATFLTTTIAGAIFVHQSIAPGGGFFGWVEQVAPINDGLAYSVPLMTILTCHEFGHYFAARAHGVPATLPFFIPVPPPIGMLGTFGAMIGMRSITTDRRKLIDIGAAGPLAGLAVAIPIIFYGLSQSPVEAMQPPQGGNGVATSLLEGNSILYAVLKYASKGLWLPDGHQDVQLSPTAWAGWAGLLVTMLNLLPIWQLDGGHIATAYAGNRWNRISARLITGLPLLALVVFLWCRSTLKAEANGNPLALRGVNELSAYAAFFWLMWYGLIRFMSWRSGGVEHPPVEERPLPRSRRLLFWLVAIVFILVYMPVPTRVTLAGTQPGPSNASTTVEGGK